MSLADRLAELERPQRCKMGDLLANLAEPDRDAMTVALADHVGYPTRQLVQVLRAEGYDVGKSTIQEHRNQGCRCGIG